MKGTVSLMILLFKIILLVFAVMLLAQYLYQKKKIVIRTNFFKSGILFQLLLVSFILYSTFLDYIIAILWIFICLLPLNSRGLTQNGLYHDKQKTYGSIFISSEVPFEETRNWELYEKRRC
ncbi:hypothetical protein SAMN04488569_10027 [Marinilactibacillus piezotolerans]|uniref:Uncharacterized protein n=1 Tax=Marinilactibacillus piezotolerans TaxID=258723 RepID=A0A1I3V1R5_9LACT|nr:hypothetical protein SAMN04488569_10027 [Marinilactibacillus piezotolerans]